MGYICHNALIVTGHEVERVHAEAVRLLAEHQNEIAGDLPLSVLSPLSESAVNGQRSFAVWPDGSKEGWPASDHGDAFRQQLIQYMETTPQLWVDWCEVRFGDDYQMNGMLRCSGEPPRLLPRHDDVAR